jgi:hypothetical protein
LVQSIVAEAISDWASTPQLFVAHRIARRAVFRQRVAESPLRRGQGA